ncbi:Cytochrome b2 mitochondrial [Fusarium albosuccineum]|uniref:Cytochrome b2 mitochondrial n=1 Tax=Fusarium albosuccineum TaxID=1237068 RepID=A0A8H4L272_9HYPO|nr:Cytochrome b2 mitochondrial [Fusarium albosuccineum]
MSTFITWSLWALLLSQFHYASAGNLTSLGDLFHGQLANLSSKAPGNNGPGRQNFGHCCRLAVNESLRIVNGSAEFVPGQTHLVGTVDDFLANPFPCDYEYKGGPGYPAQVYVTYSWCNSNCPGYSLTRPGRKGLNGWLKPLVLFIIPSAVFSLNVPRRRRINVPSRMFPDNLSSLWSLFTLIYKVPIAATIVTLDILIWNVIIMTFAGPMMLSGLYEAMLDRKIMYYLRQKMLTRSLNVQQRAHLLFVALFGCLDLDKAWDISVNLVQGLPMDNLRRRKSSTQPLTHTDTLGPFSPTSSNNRSYSDSRMRQMVQADYSVTHRSHIDRAKLKLQSALETQISFGSAAGAAVVFYCGNFAYALLELQSDYGRVYTTPSTGLGCRSLTLLVYACAECLLTLLWAAKVFELDVALGIQGDGPFEGSLGRITSICVKFVWLSAVAFNVFVSFFTGVVGTGFIISSFYTNCFCATPTSKEQILNAQIYWIPAAIGATCLLAATAYLGWWFSNLMRDSFKGCTANIDAFDPTDDYGDSGSESPGHRDHGDI